MRTRRGGAHFARDSSSALGIAKVIASQTSSQALMSHVKLNLKLPAYVPASSGRLEFEDHGSFLHPWEPRRMLGRMALQTQCTQRRVHAGAAALDRRSTWVSLELGPRRGSSSSADSRFEMNPLKLKWR